MTPEKLQELRTLFALYGLSLRKLHERSYLVIRKSTKRSVEMRKRSGRVIPLKFHLNKPVEFYIEWLRKWQASP